VDAFQSEFAKDVRTPVVNPPASAKDAYPIAGLTFLLLPKQSKDPAKEQTLKQFVQYIITDGQNSAQELDYSKLPRVLASQDEKLLAQIPAGGEQTQTSSNSNP
jgi:phosphate transport system substrate-binding protein